MHAAQTVRRGLVAMAAIVMAFSLTACSNDSGNGDPSPSPTVDGGIGDSAIWVLSDDADLTPASTTVTIDVTRIGCSSGVTGTPLDPIVEYEPTRIIIRAHVAPHIDGGNCLGNPSERHTFTLPEPIGDRFLVDGECLSGPAVNAFDCQDPIRWRAPKQ